MEFQYIFNILVVILFIFIIFKKSNENFSNISKQDLEGVQNIASMYKNGELKIAKLHVTDNAQFDKNTNTDGNIYSKNWIQGKHLKSTKDSWIDGKLTTGHLHVNDHSSTRRLDIRNDKNKGTTHFNYNHNGQNYIRGHNHDVLHTDHLYVADNINTRRLEVRNDATNDKTYFNYAHKGGNYLSGHTVIRPLKTLTWNGTHWKNHLKDGLGAKVGDLTFVKMKHDGWDGLTTTQNYSKHHGGNRITNALHWSHHHRF